MSKIILKAAAEFLGLSPEGLQQMAMDGQKIAADGIQYLESIDKRLDAICAALHITIQEPDNSIDELLLLEKEVEHGE